MRLYVSFQLLLNLVIITKINGLSSPITPFTEYKFSIELLPNMTDLCWNVDNVTKMVTFELHMKTTGWIALGISPNGGMAGADIGLGWINSTGGLTFQDRYATGNQRPMIDDTTTDWFGIQGREQDGWTAIQFRRLIDTCDTMDVPIKSGSNILIFAWDDVDPDSTDDIQYHYNRRDSVVVPLLSYSQPPSQDKLVELEIVEFFASGYTVPTDKSTYYCEVFRQPAIFEKKHAIAREIVLQSSADDLNLVYHLSLSECNPEAAFDDDNLPRGICDGNVTAFSQCTYNIVIGWGKGGDHLVEFPEEAGLPIDSINPDMPPRYYMLQINYYNGDGVSDHMDSSGVRLYIGNELRPYDLGGLTFGVHSLPSGIAIPPQVPSFAIDSYCGADASRSNFPASGLTFFSFFGHTHSQGKSVLTKVIRNGTAVEYLFNAESYNPDYQFQHQLLQPVTLYPGDALVSRCEYQTMDKSNVTLGGRLPADEMCTQVFNYYPRMDNLYICASAIAPSAWQAYLNITVPINETTLSQRLRSMNWTAKAASDMQEFYNTAARATAFGRAGTYNISLLASLPTYQDINIDVCQNPQNTSTTTGSTTTGTTTTTPTTTGTTTTTPTTTETTTPSTTTMPTTTTTRMPTTSIANNTIIIPTGTTTVRGMSNNLAVEKTLFIFSSMVLTLINGKII